MKIPDIQLFVQALLYLTIFFLGFTVSVPLGLFQMDFNGKCMLYAEIDWKNATFFVITEGESINCHFTIYFNVFACILFALGMFAYYGYAVLRRDPDIGSQMWVMPFVLISAVMCVVEFIAACIISVGYKQLCSGLADNSKKLSCSKVAELTKFQNDYNGKHIIPYLTAAQTAGWICFLCWAVQWVLGIIRFVRNRRSRSGAFNDSVNSSNADTAKIGDIQPTA
ncbi:hypothetical protein LOTGIDRAFT_232478 [Lottia gigantea]|uniref:MARVEL domain-containing protein n=1 Tax=Lottia gigantea TaxID=225164 RepID=V4AGE0_LOTGI|nr:hypothetical protein LOTGIDRAFT_232478 [Lottia gigantea]ESO94235.1 hypothetical protein LOTGIDRAFT_232478 [Lottia gigantea]